MDREGLPVQAATRILGVLEFGVPLLAGPAALGRAVRHTWLSDEIEAVHAVSKGVYGARRCVSRVGASNLPWHGMWRGVSRAVLAEPMAKGPAAFTDAITSLPLP